MKFNSLRIYIFVTNNIVANEIISSPVYSFRSVELLKNWLTFFRKYEFIIPTRCGDDDGKELCFFFAFAWLQRKMNRKQLDRRQSSSSIRNNGEHHHY
jgi:hypothetical protein